MKTKTTVLRYADDEIRDWVMVSRGGESVKIPTDLARAYRRVEKERTKLRRRIDELIDASRQRYEQRKQSPCRVARLSFEKGAPFYIVYSSRQGVKRILRRARERGNDIAEIYNRVLTDVSVLDAEKNSMILDEFRAGSPLIEDQRG
jgi:hypothetical protein